MVNSLTGAIAVGLLAMVGLVCFGTPAAAVDVDLRGYITQSTPGYKWCDAGSGICLDGYRNEFNAFIVSYANGIVDHFERDDQSPWLFGVHRNLDGSEWRCFSNPGVTCGFPQMADFPPQAVPLIMGLPVLAGSSINNNRVTPGALLIPEYGQWQLFEVRRLESDCGSPIVLGTTWQKVYAFVADAVSFGGDLGARTNVLVIEQETYDGFYGQPANTSGGDAA